MEASKSASSSISPPLSGRNKRTRREKNCYDSNHKHWQIAIMKTRTAIDAERMFSSCANIHWKCDESENPHSISPLEWISNINIFPCSASYRRRFSLRLPIERIFFLACSARNRSESVLHRPLTRSRGPFRRVSVTCELLVEKKLFLVWLKRQSWRLKFWALNLIRVVASATWQVVRESNVKLFMIHWWN